MARSTLTPDQERRNAYAAANMLPLPFDDNRPVNILDLPRSEFMAMLPEIQQSGGDVDMMLREYNRRNSIFAPIMDAADRSSQEMTEAGRRPVAGTMGLLSRNIEGDLGLRPEPMAALTGLLGGTAGAVDQTLNATVGRVPAADVDAAALTGAGLAMGGGGLLSRPAGSIGMGGRVAAPDLNVARKDASSIFGAGTERVRYTDPNSGGTMEVVVRPDGSASVLELEVPEGFRGQGIGQALQSRVMQDFPVMGGQVSSRAAATTAYRLGRRPYGRPDATIEDVFRAIDEDSSVNLITPAAQPRPVSPAQEVAALLRSGRAADVTDEMMARVDPQEMFALYQRGETGMDLPMDEASRMRRAIQQGFDVNDEMYRGDAPRLAFQTGQGQRDQIGVTMSSSPDVAASYIPARGDGGIYPIFSRGQSDAIIDAQGRNWNVIDRNARVGFQGDDSLLRDYIPDSYFEPYDVMSGTDFLDTNDLSRMFQGYGADRVRFNDLVDRGGSAKYYGPESSMPSDVMMVSNPANVRSRFARFDSRLSNLSNLNAANVSPLAGLLATGAGQAEMERLRPLLGLLAER